MSSWFQLTLDTHAPVVQWGEPTGTTAGELLRVPYTLNEPGVESATLTLADGRALAMSVLAGRLEVLLPPDAPDGIVTVRASLVDDVGNWAQAVPLSFPIGGTIVVPPTEPPPVPSRPAGLKPRPRKFVSSRSRLRTSCPAEVRRGAVRVRTAADTASRASTRARTAGSSQLAASSSATTMVTVRVVDATAARAELSNVTLHRRPGPSIENALLLDLL